MGCQLDHIHLVCKDMEPTIDFFITHFGARLVGRKRFGEADGAVLDLDGATINLRLALADEQLADHAIEKPLGYHHIGIRVPDLDTLHRDLMARGFHFPVPPKDTPDNRIAFVEGPEHLVIELMQPKAR